ncbi:GAF domain-containing protein [Sphingomonas carotinifaciens]|uniref:GAF domain-containing protein n=1 Tax=Sphingomonas carotinifaciens TaxID=1166323 RepID=UPI0012370E04|nr:GAF domain-containing protein [Sphingomonas carotinifaciens]
MSDPYVSSWLNAFSAEKRRQLAVDHSGVLAMRGSKELDRIVDIVRDHYQTAYAAISIIDRRSQILLAERGLGVEETPRSTAFCATTIQQDGEPLIVPDARADARFADFGSVQGDPFIRFYAGVPIADDAGLALGAVCVADTKPLTMEFDRALLVIMAHEVERTVSSLLPVR